MNDKPDWSEINDQHLSASVTWVRLRLEQLAEPEKDNSVADVKTRCGWFKQTKKTSQQANKSKPQFDLQALESAWQQMTDLETHDSPPILIQLANTLGLTSFDRYVLMLCVAMEFDTRIARLCALAQHDPNKPYPTFALAFELFDDPDWNSLSPQAALRYWRLLEINQAGAQPLTAAALAADERIVNYLKGLMYLDDRLTPLLNPMQNTSDMIDLTSSQLQNANHIIGRLQQRNGQQHIPIIELLGHDKASKQLLTRHVTNALELNLYSIDINNIPSHTGDFETFSRLWQRESLLMPLALTVVAESLSNTEKSQLNRFLDRCNSVIFLDLQEPNNASSRFRHTVEVNKPTPEEQQQLWLNALQNHAGKLPQRLAEQFSFSQNEIKRLAGSVLNEPDTLENNLWQACRSTARAGMEQLAQRIEVKASWEQLILPAEHMALLQQITDQVAQRNQVYEDWGFRKQMNRGLGINALFAGESGTGKTMAAEVIANALQLDLYRIDLSAVISKYIGETEKNLRKLFDAAEDSGAILFFDEADSLFGKRSEVKDSHDRYANIEINYLLQRMESYRGLAILATNMKSALDKAFVRRLRFIVDFPFPGVEQRQEIWQKVFPAETPIEKSLDYDRLAKLNLTGGSIINIALNAAFLAAQDNQSVTMPLILNAARTEFKKLDRPAKEADFRWLSTAEVT